MIEAWHPRSSRVAKSPDIVALAALVACRRCAGAFRFQTEGGNVSHVDLAPGVDSPSSLSLCALQGQARRSTCRVATTHFCATGRIRELAPLFSRIFFCDWSKL